MVYRNIAQSIDIHSTHHIADMDSWQAMVFFASRDVNDSTITERVRPYLDDGLSRDTIIAATRYFARNGREDQRAMDQIARHLRLHADQYNRYELTDLRGNPIIRGRGPYRRAADSREFQMLIEAEVDALASAAQLSETARLEVYAALGNPFVAEYVRERRPGLYGKLEPPRPRPVPPVSVRPPPPAVAEPAQAERSRSRSSWLSMCRWKSLLPR